MLINEVSHNIIVLNTLRPRQNDDTLKHIFLNENVRILIEISPKFVPWGSINNTSALVQIMDCRRPGDKPWSKPILFSLLTHICDTRPQWVKSQWSFNHLFPCRIQFLEDYCNSGNNDSERWSWLMRPTYHPASWNSTSVDRNLSPTHPGFRVTSTKIKGIHLCDWCRVIMALMIYSWVFCWKIFIIITSLSPTYSNYMVVLICINVLVVNANIWNGKCAPATSCNVYCWIDARLDQSKFFR